MKPTRGAPSGLVPVVVANATLTLVAGLMALLSAVLAATRWRLAVRVPYAEPAAAHGLKLAWWVASQKARRMDRGGDGMPN